MRHGNSKPQRKSGALVAVVGVAGLLALTSTARAVSSFSFTASPACWVADGFTDLFASPETGWRFTGVGSVDHTFVELRATHPDHYFFTFDLKAPAGQTLMPKFYPSATKYPFQGSGPGLYLSGNARGDQSVTGNFTISEIDFGPGNTLNSIAVQFQQFDNGNLGKWMYATWIYNPPSAAVAAPMPEPAFLGVIALGAAAIAAAGRRNRAH